MTNNVTPLPMPPDNNGRDGKGRFASGPNNVGRPLGAKARHTRDLSALVRAMSGRAAQKLSEALDNNERWAIELIIKLCLASGITFEMNGLEPEDIEKAVIDGEIAPERANAMMATKKAIKAIRELDDHRAMMKEILEKLQTR